MFDFRLLPFSEFNVHFTEFLQIRHPQDHQFHSRPSTCFNPSTRSTINPQSCQPLNPPPSTSTRSCASTMKISRRLAHFSHCTRRFGTWTQDVTTPWKDGNFRKKKTRRILPGKKTQQQSHGGKQLGGYVFFVGTGSSWSSILVQGCERVIFEC